MRGVYSRRTEKCTNECARTLLAGKKIGRGGIERVADVLTDTNGRAPTFICRNAGAVQHRLRWRRAPSHYQLSTTGWLIMLGAPPGPAGSGLPKRGKAPSVRARSISISTSARVFGA